MNFIIAERYGLKYLIIENTWPYEYWTLTITKYLCSFEKLRLNFKELDGMTVRVSDKEGIDLLKQYADNRVIGHKVTEFIKRYEALPF